MDRSFLHDPDLKNLVAHTRNLPLRPAFRWDLHKQMWGILAETGWGSKIKALRKMGLGRIPEVSCFACEAESRISCADPFPTCVCPLDWGYLYKEPCMMGLFDQWLTAETKEERKRLAALIRDLPLAPYARDIYAIIE